MNIPLKDQIKVKWLESIRAARTDLAKFIEMVVRDDHGVGITLAPVHLSWIRHLNYCWERDLRALILAPFGHGKCEPAGARIQLADGSVAKIETLVGREVELLAFDERAMAFRKAQGRCFDNGERPVVGLRLKSGRYVRATENHPMFIFGDGWCPVGRLKVGDRVGVAHSLPEATGQKMRPGEAELLGMIVGDGSTTECSVVYTSGEMAMRERAAGLARGLGFDPVPQTRQRDTIAIRLNKAMPWIRAHGLRGLGSWTKITPAAVMTAPNEDVRSYLRGYFACDGTVTEFRGGCVELYSVNRVLLDDVKTLLLRFGVRSRIAKKIGKYKGERHESWRLTISGVRDVSLFRRAVGTSSPRKEAKLAGMLLGTGNPNVDTIPLTYRKMLKKTAHWHKVNTGVSLDQMSKKGTSREVVRLAASAERNSELLRWTEDTVFWDEIVAVDDLGVQQTFGIEVDVFHTYVSNDVIMHNSSSLLVPLGAYLIGQDPNVRIKIITNDDDSASKRVGAIKRIIESPVYRQVFPAVLPGGAWTGHEVYVKRVGHAVDPTVHARGIFTTGIGGRADVELYDDVVDQKNSMDPAQRKKVLSLIEETWLSRLEPDGAVLGIGTTWHCLPSDGSVLTPRGRIAAHAVTTDTLVEVGAGQFDKVVKVKSRPYSGELCEIRSAWCCEPLRLTGEHRLPTPAGLKRADEITTEDWLELAIPPTEPQVDLATIGPADPALAEMENKKADAKRLPYLPIKFDAARFESMRKDGETRKEIAATLGISAGQVSYVASRLGLGGSKKGLGRLKADASRPGFWRLVGLWIAEGTSCDHDREVSFHFGNSEKEAELAAFVEGELRHMGLPCKNAKERGSWRVHVYNASLGRWLAENFGKRAGGKRLPTWWARLPHEHMMAAFHGWVEGDGRKVDEQYAAWTISKDLAFDWQRALWAHGIRAATHRRAQTTKGIGGRAFKTVAPYSYKLYMSAQTPLKANARVLYADGKVWLRVTEVGRVPYEGDIYDLQTSTGYFTGSVHRIHNSDDALHHLMQRPRWCTLRQSVADDCTEILQEVIGARDDYPDLAA